MNQSRWFCLFLIVMVAAVGVALRLLVAGNDELWLDELHTAWVTGDSGAVVGSRAAIGNQSELFFWMVWWARGVLGDSVLALRAVSLFAGLLLIFFASFLTWSWTRSTLSALVVAWLIAVDPQFVFYATEARPYVLVETLSVLQVFLFWNWLTRFHAEPASADTKSPGLELGNGILLAIVTVLLLATHPTSGWLPISELVFLTIYTGVASFRPLWNFSWYPAIQSTALITAMAAVGCLPLFSSLPQLFARRGNWSPVSSIPNLLDDFRMPILLSIALPIFLAMIFYFPKQDFVKISCSELKNTQRRTIQLWFVSLWALLPVALVVLSDHFQIAPLALTRYTLVGAVAFPIFCGLVVGLPGSACRQLAVAVILIGASLFQNPFAYSLLRYQNLALLRFENWSAPIEEINRRPDKMTHPVYLFSNLIEDVAAFETDDPEFQEYLRFPISGLYRIDLQQRQAMAAPTLGHQHFRSTDISLMRAQGGAWLMVRGDPGLVMEICNELQLLAARMLRAEAADALGTVTETNNPHGTANEPLLQFAQFPFSNVHLVSVDWPASPPISMPVSH